MSRNYKRKKQVQTNITHVVRPVAGNANPRHKKPNREERRLAGRIKDWEELKSKDGFHKPGSLQR